MPPARLRIAALRREFGRVTTDSVTCPVGQVLQVTVRQNKDFQRFLASSGLDLWPRSNPKDLSPTDWANETMRPKR